MSVRVLIIAGGLFAATAALAQTLNQQAAQTAANWEMLRKLYPPRAVAAREEGAVGFKVTLDSKGSVTECEVTRSSGHPLLDQETCNLITLHAVLKPAANVSGSRAATSDGVIIWKLPASSTTTFAAPRALSADAAPEKVICKKVPKTGSLASFERTCLTSREWARQSDDAKDMWGDVQGKKGSTNGN
jgi:protein TonB